MTVSLKTLEGATYQVEQIHIESSVGRGSKLSIGRIGRIPEPLVCSRAGGLKLIFFLILFFCTPKAAAV